MENKVNFVTFFDERYLPLFKMLYKSIESLYLEDEFTFLIGITSSAENEMKSWINEQDINNIQYIIINNELKSFNNNGLFGNITIVTYCRLVMKELFKEKISLTEKYIYLDTDILLKKRIDIPKELSNHNFAISNTSFTSTKDRVSFWSGIYNEKLNTNNNISQRKNIEKTKISILSKINKGIFFNAGVIFINNLNKYLELVDEINEDKLGVKRLVDDQTLLNLYNKEHIKVIGDVRFNYKVNLTSSIDDAFLVHFSYSDKSKMFEVYDEGNLNFELLENKS